MKATITQLIVHVRDMARSIAFYRDALGLTARYESDRWTEFAAGSVTLALHPRDELAARETMMMITLAVEDLDRACRELREKGIAVEGPLQLGDLPPLANLHDPDGVTICLTARA